MRFSLNIIKQGLQLGVLGIALLCCLTAYAGGWMLTDQHNHHYIQNDSHEKWVLINVWAPWCPSCLHEMPNLVDLQQRYHQSLQVIGVAVMYASPERVEDARDKAKLNYPIVMGNEDIASNIGSIRGLPTSFLYAPDGHLVKKINGEVTRANVEKILSKALKLSTKHEGF